MTLFMSPEGDTQKITTIEQAHYWLRKRWPVTDNKRDLALKQIDAAMNCLVPVGAARNAFRSAAKSAGFKTRNTAAETENVF
jgi:hypothetical protein